MNQPRLANSQKICVGCANPLHVTTTQCPSCGAQQYRFAAPLGRKSRVAAAVLALFLGGLGAHHFYLGRVTAGIFSLLFCWTLIPSLIALVECIIYLTMSDEAFAAKYG